MDVIPYKCPFILKPWGIEKYSVPYMVQIELTYISIKCGIVNPYIAGFTSQRAYYAIAPRHPPHLEYIIAKEPACQKLNQQDVEKLRADINRVLRGSHPQA